jgi:hypothetical protein
VDRDAFGDMGTPDQKEDCYPFVSGPVRLSMCCRNAHAANLSHDRALHRNTCRNHRSAFDLTGILDRAD